MAVYIEGRTGNQMEEETSRTEPTVQVQMCGISKSFGGVNALKEVNFSVDKGEIHALVGENGAGKSTLMKILSGAYQLDEGQIFIEGKEAYIHSPKAGIDHGISVIYQEFALVNHLTVAENIFIDNLNEGRAIINWNALRKKAKKLLDELGFGQIDVKKQVSQLSVAYQQVIEICKALSRKARILILDEPTAVLSSNEAEQLFMLLEKLRDSGVAIVYISHRMEEIFRVCDRITVLKDGEHVVTVGAKDIDEKSLVNMMIGRDIKSYFPTRETHIGDVVFEVKNISRGNIVNDVSFKVRAGEVFGLTGLVGSGRTETVRAIFGEDKKDGGHIFFGGAEVKIHSPKAALKIGVALLPEDRKAQGVLLDIPILYNVTVSCLKRFCRLGGVIRAKEERGYAQDLADKLQIKMRTLNDNVSSLSGGNQQKVALSKLLAAKCNVLILDEPTRGVDVGAKIEIYKIINSLASEGNAVIMISSEMPEVIGMCDRVAVMRAGRIMGELSKCEICEENLINFAMGVKN
ncbi:MAG: sugar ABC transporter ATP-binding protein [Christensenellales bacterium]